MSVAVVIVLALIALAYVARPLLSQASAIAVDPRNDAELRKLEALQAILDLEAELAAGKLSREDFEVFRETHERDALSAMRELDVASRRVADTDLEAEIAAARARLR